MPSGAAMLRMRTRRPGGTRSRSAAYDVSAPPAECAITRISAPGGASSMAR